MEDVNVKSGSLASQSAEINRLFDLLEDTAPAPSPSVPALESERPIADNAVYRHQSLPALPGESLRLHPFRQIAINHAARLLAADCLIVDTETTGLNHLDQIVEISVLNASGKLVWGSLIKPSIPIPSVATAIHGITDEMVLNAPDFHDVFSEFASLFNRGVPVLFYDADFDLRMIRQTSMLWCLDEPFSLVASNPVCAMRLYSQFVGEWDDYRDSYRWHNLVTAARACGVPVVGAHRSYGDCLMTLGVLRYMAQFAEVSK